MKRFLIAPDSFKGTMSADTVASIVKDAILARIPDAEITCLPMADGGEGLTDACLRILGGEKVTLTVTGPMGTPVEAFYGILPSGEAVMEMAACAGLPLVTGAKNPLAATTYGVGEMLIHAQKRGVTDVLLGLGGSATNDGGVGMARALGFTFTDRKNQPFAPTAGTLQEIGSVSRPETPLNLTVRAACDVDNPLCGPEGATYTFGPQKGVTEAMLGALDAGLANLAVVMARDLGADVALFPGAGAAGGLGAGVMAFLSGSLLPGIDMLLDAAHFDERLQNADMVFTGEGRMDWQSAHGKVPVGVSRRAKKAGVPCVALCGALGEGFEAVYDEGVTAAFSAVRGACDFETIKETCQRDYRALADAVIRLLQIKEERT